MPTHTPQELYDELKGLLSEAEKMMADSVSDLSTEALNSLRERFSAAQERFTDVYQGTRKKVVAGAKYTDTTIRDNPYQSIAIAAGVGLVFGLLIGRRGR